MFDMKLFVDTDADIRLTRRGKYAKFLLMIESLIEEIA